jgi:hypothetical protein
MHGKVNFFPLVMMVRWPPPGCRIIVIFPVNKPMADFSLRRVSVTFEGIATIRCHRAGRDISGQSFRLGYRVLWSSQISVRLAQPMFVDDISESDTTDWPKPAH